MSCIVKRFSIRLKHKVAIEVATLLNFFLNYYYIHILRSLIGSVLMGPCEKIPHVQHVD